MCITIQAILISVGTLVTKATVSNSVAFSSTFVRNDNLTDQVCLNDTVSLHSGVPSAIACVAECLKIKPDAVFYSRAEQHCQCHGSVYDPTWLCYPRSGYKFYTKVEDPPSVTPGLMGPAVMATSSPAYIWTTATTVTTTGPTTTVTTTGPATTMTTTGPAPTVTTTGPATTVTTSGPAPTVTTTGPAPTVTTTGSVTTVTTSGPAPTVTTADPVTTVTTTGPATTSTGLPPSTSPAANPSDWQFSLFPNHTNYGVLEVTYNGQLGYMCEPNSHIGSATLHTICRDYLQLGTYGFRLPDDYAVVDPASNYNFLLYGMTSCNISGCSESDWYNSGSGLCSGKPLQIYCTDTFLEGIRFVDGNTPDNGRIEVYFAGQWGQICHQASVNDPNLHGVLCRAMNYSMAVGSPTMDTLNPASAYGPKFIERTTCPSGGSVLLQDCDFSLDAACDTLGDKFDTSVFDCAY